MDGARAPRLRQNGWARSRHPEVGRVAGLRRVGHLDLVRWRWRWQSELRSGGLQPLGQLGRLRRPESVEQATQVAHEDEHRREHAEGAADAKGLPAEFSDERIGV